MLIFLEDNEAKKIVFIADPTGEYFPMFEVLFKENKLEGMPWRISERPDKPLLEFEGPPRPPKKVKKTQCLVKYRLKEK